ncbi:molybdenum cofactor guanylyltransferase [Kutzneria chonburiensis]|uniref:Molybdenum cofactor guanylyltransferase n=1 Tax=Kutzneria chonburiensis TaxID=1483604 RepID=A0ABV6MM11_9PSEU|nr:NTP transferase domain-containing protein [Kutzneria chonburiensis]
MTDFAAVLLAGGGGRRMGGVHKPALVVAGSTLLDRCLQAVADASPVVVVGPSTETARPVRWTREDPPGGGPVAGLAAGLKLVDAPLVAVLATDLVGVTAKTVQRLRAAVTNDGAVLDDGHRQWLIGVWRTEALRRVLPEDPAGASLRSVLGALDYAPVAAEPGETVDVDTPADLARAASQHPHR